MAADHGPDHGPRPVRAARGSSLAGSPIPAEPFRSDELMAYPDQLDFGVRQRSYTATRLLRGVEVRTTFLARLWVDLMFGVPERFRGDQLLYREIQKFAYPRLVSLPATSDDGGSATQVPVHPDLAARGVIDRLDVKSFLPGEPGRPADDEPRESDITGLLGLELNLKSPDRLGNGAWVNRADLG